MSAQQKHAFSRLFYRTAFLWRTRLEEHLRFWSMNLTSWQILWFLHLEDVRYNQYMLAAKLGIETSHLVRLLDRMEKRGLLKREANPQDRRQNHVIITPSGTALVGEIEAVIIRLRQEMLVNIAADDLEDGIHLLEGMLGNLVQMSDAEQSSRSVEARPLSAPSFLGKYSQGIERRSSADRRGGIDRRSNADRRRGGTVEQYAGNLDRRSHVERRSPMERRGKVERRRRVSSR
ncbi:MAG: MarR family transcriptional regulator [Zoogloeaceae bacterium]|jgi:MarR family transcriptional regulator for hemolysin|nr:MarR family transcriptional regulator [Zoogloeaceae bacterium]